MKEKIISLIALINEFKLLNSKDSVSPESLGFILDKIVSLSNEIYESCDNEQLKDAIKNLESLIADKSLSTVNSSLSPTSKSYQIKQKDGSFVTLTIPAATDTQAGVMTAEDKQKLDELPETINNITIRTIQRSPAEDKLTFTILNEDKQTLSKFEIPLANGTSAGLLSPAERRQLQELPKEVEGNAIGSVIITPRTTSVDIALQNGKGGNVSDYIPAATDTQAGVMTAEDKQKLDELEKIDYSNQYYTTTTAGIVFGNNNNLSNVTEFEIGPADFERAGVMTAEDKKKLDELEKIDYSNQYYNASTIGIVFGNNNNLRNVIEFEFEPATPEYAGVMSAADKRLLLEVDAREAVMVAGEVHSLERVVDEELESASGIDVVLFPGAGYLFARKTEADGSQKLYRTWPNCEKYGRLLGGFVHTFDKRLYFRNGEEYCAIYQNINGKCAQLGEFLKSALGINKTWKLAVDEAIQATNNRIDALENSMLVEFDGVKDSVDDFDNKLFTPKINGIYFVRELNKFVRYMLSVTSSGPVTQLVAVNDARFAYSIDCNYIYKSRDVLYKWGFATNEGDGPMMISTTLVRCYNEHIEGLTEQWKKSVDENKQNKLADSTDIAVNQETGQLSLLEAAKRAVFNDEWDTRFNPHITSPTSKLSLGKYDPINAPNPKTPYLAYGSLWLSYEDALKVIQFSPLIISGTYSGAFPRGLKTLAPILFKADNDIATSVNVSAFNNTDFEVLYLRNVKLNYGTATMNSLRSLTILWPTTGTTRINAPLLEDFRFHTAAWSVVDSVVQLMLPQSSKLSLASVQNIVGKLAGKATTQTITVHPDVYAKLTDESNAEWYQVLQDAASKNISFASA